MRKPNTKLSTATPPRHRRTLRAMLAAGAVLATAAVFAIAAPALADDHADDRTNDRAPRVERLEKDRPVTKVDRKRPRLTVATPVITVDAKDAPIADADGHGGRNGKGTGHDKARGKGHTEHGNGLGLGHDKHDCNGDDHTDADRPTGKKDKADKAPRGKKNKKDEADKGQKPDKAPKGKKDKKDKAPTTGDDTPRL